jgi:GH15 family glucan-1,4-alpha-glucosidase
MASKIEDYALLGDCETAALVDRDGSVDWLCWPRFDSGACLAALLGHPQNGRWLISPCDPAPRRRRRYRDRTLVLETDIETSEGAITLVEFMPPREKASDLVRLVVGRRGQVRMRTELIIRFDYGLLVPWATRQDDGSHLFVSGPDMVVLRTPIALRGDDMKTVGEFTVSPGETVPFVLTYGASHLDPPQAIDPTAALADTETFWRDWSGCFNGAGEWSGPQSLIVLKALTYRPTGAVVAAPTTSLPEKLGGNRNWDYRFCWLRDATFTLLALMNSGYRDEAREWRNWLRRAVAGDAAQVQILYGLTGEHRVPEWNVPWLDGYEGSRPVRAGNAAALQTQLDVYGEVMDALHQARMVGLAPHRADWQLQRNLLEHLESIANAPGQSLWEIRGEAKHFTLSKVMIWVAFDRAAKAVDTFGLDGPAERWRAKCREIHEEVCRNGFNPDVGAFVQSYGSRELDASVLLIPLVGFLPPDDQRMIETVRRIEQQLMVDGFVFRFGSNHDDLPGGEGAFLACSFWLADNYVLQGRRDDARRLFERLLSLRNDVGLLSEQYDPRAKRLVGNFPQAFSHIALVNTAHNLAGKSAKQRSDTASY